MTRASTVLRPVGFRPWEISAMINQGVIDQHAEEAAFLWTQRDHATKAPQYALKDLAKLDERVEAHVDGLRVAANAGWETAVAQIEQGPGEVFATSVLAFESADSDRIKRVLEAGSSAPQLARGLISALGWMQQDAAVREAQKLAASQQPEVRRAGIAGMAAHRVDPGPLLMSAIVDPNAPLAARAMRAAAELGRIDLVPGLIERLSDANEECRFWAAWGAVRLGLRPASVAVAILGTTTEAAGPLAERAIDLALRVMRVEDGHAWRERLSENPETARLAVIGAGILGDPATVPWLIHQMENPELARVAGAAFSMITGVDLGYEDLNGDAPPGWDIDDEVTAPDSDSDFQWPLPAAVAQWWSKHGASYVPGVRYLAGEPITDYALREVLSLGKQNQRAAAALELALRHPSEVLFETRERAQWQRRKLAQWSS